MKGILIILAVVAAFVYFANQYLRKPLGLKPILPTVFFESGADPNVIAVDFAACAPAKGTVSGEFGSIKIEMWSWDVNTCLVNYSSPEEKKFSSRCVIPKSLDKKIFNKTPNDVDFSEIAGFCKPI